MSRRALFQSVIPAALQVLELEGFLHHCIEAAAVLVRTFEKEGVEAYPLTVGVKVMNPAMTLFTKRNGKPPHDEETMMQCHAEGGAIVVLDPESEETPQGNWPGHLVVIVPQAFGELHAMIDLTIPQVNDPDWDISVKPMLVQVSDKFVTGDSFSAESNGAMLIYRSYPENRTFGEWDELINSDEADRLSEMVIESIR